MKTNILIALVSTLLIFIACKSKSVVSPDSTEVPIPETKPVKPIAEEMSVVITDSVLVVGTLTFDADITAYSPPFSAIEVTLLDVINGTTDKIVFDTISGIFKRLLPRSNYELVANGRFDTFDADGAEIRCIVLPDRIPFSTDTSSDLPFLDFNFKINARCIVIPREYTGNTDETSTENDSKKDNTPKTGLGSTDPAESGSYDKNKLNTNEAELSAAEFLARLENMSNEEVVQQIAARVIESFPDTMLLQERTKVGVLLSSNTADEFLEAIIANDPLLKQNPERVRSFIASGIGKIMASQLIDIDDAFEIDPLFTQNQKFVDLDAGTPQRWEWFIKPIKAGKHILTYALERIEIVEGKERIVTSIPVVENEVTVIVEREDTNMNMPSPVEEKSQQGGMGWILPIAVFGIIALVGSLLLLLFRKKKEQEQVKIKLPSNEVRTLIAQSRTNKALTLLADATKAMSRQNRNKITLLQSQWAAVESEITKGIIDGETADLKRNQIHARILGLLDDFEQRR